MLKHLRDLTWDERVILKFSLTCLAYLTHTHKLQRGIYHQLIILQDMSSIIWLFYSTLTYLSRINYVHNYLKQLKTDLIWFWYFCPTVLKRIFTKNQKVSNICKHMDGFLPEVLKQFHPIRVLGTTVYPSDPPTCLPITILEWALGTSLIASVTGCDMTYRGHSRIWLPT